ncbi:MAG: hypothetical protein JZU64_06805 [Rhodoferax sp.]|nr:hypothetical protein [Rhodoferax sp.]
MSSQFFALQTQLIARLRARLDAVGQTAVPLLTTPDLTSIDGLLPAPCIFVVTDGYAITEASSSRKQARITQHWQVIVCVRHQVAQPAAATAITLAGTLADLVITSLIGWHPTGYSKPLALASAAKPDREDGHFWLPVAFEAEIVYHAAP